MIFFLGNGLWRSMVRHYAKRLRIQCTNSVGLILQRVEPPTSEKLHSTHCLYAHCSDIVRSHYLLCVHLLSSEIY